MKIKASWLFFVPIFVVSVALSVYQVLFVNNGLSAGFFDGSLTSVIFLCAIAFLFVIIAVLFIRDKETNGNYIISKNTIAGTALVISGALVLCQGVLSVTVLDKANFATITGALISLLAGYTMCRMGIGSVTGNNIMHKSKFLILCPSIWGAYEMVSVFMGYAKESVHAVNMLDLVCLVFLSLFLLNACVIYANIFSNSAVKSCFLFGMTAITVVFSYASSSIASEIVTTGTFNIINNIDLLSYIALSVFALFFIAELSGNCETIEEAELKEREFIYESKRNSDVTYIIEEDNKKRFKATEKATEKVEEKATEKVEYTPERIIPNKQKDEMQDLYNKRLAEIDNLINSITSSGESK